MFLQKILVHGNLYAENEIGGKGAKTRSSFGETCDFDFQKTLFRHHVFDTSFATSSKQVHEFVVFFWCFCFNALKPHSVCERNVSLCC